MIFLHLKPQEMHILQTKKSVLQGNETSWATKSFAKAVMHDGTLKSVDLIASTIKDVCADLPKLSESEVTLILDHSLYSLSRTELGTDVAATEYHTFLKDAHVAAHKIKDPDAHVYEMIVKEFENQKYGFVYAFDKEQLALLEQAITLLELKTVAVIPEHLAYYALFEKTLRLDKHEHILFCVFDEGIAEGYIYDTFGPIPEAKPWRQTKVTLTSIESLLKGKAEEWSNKNPKLHRIIISGSESDKIRQDTFTKNVGVWTNPLKRILPHFYQEYLTLLKSKQESAPVFPALQLSALLGGFITAQDGKSFPYQKIGLRKKVTVHDAPVIHSPSTMETTSEKRGFRLPKEIILFIVIFLITFGLFYFIAASKGGSGVTIPFLAPQPTVTLTPSPSPVPPTPTPTVEVKRAEVNVKVLNGTGVAGQAGGVRQALVTAGYVGVVTGNADKYDYVQSVVQIASAKMYLKDTVLADIKAIIADPSVEEIKSTDEKADVVIIIGKDSK